jgi:hypothetical protein
VGVFHLSLRHRLQLVLTGALVLAAGQVCPQRFLECAGGMVHSRGGQFLAP